MMSRCLCVPAGVGLAILVFATGTVSADGDPPALQGAKAEMPASRFPKVDGIVKGQFLDLKDGRIYARYSAIADSGVELERANAAGAVVWRVMVAPLGVDHSKYKQSVEIWMSDDEHSLFVTSEGGQRIVESRSIKDGSLFSRKIEEIKRGVR